MGIFMYTGIFIVLINIIGITIFIIHSKNMKAEEYKSERWIKIFVFLNIFVIFSFFEFIFFATMTTTTIWIYIVLLINIVMPILVFNKKILKNKKIVNCIIIVYLLLMIILPGYKIDGHEHTFDYTKMEVISHYTAYYNCYGIRLYKVIEEE